MATYRVRYQTLEFGDLDIHLRTLRDRNQFADDDGAAERVGIGPGTWPLFGVVWASSQVLAHYVHDRSTDGLRILEVGCGIGLTSMVLQQRNEDITATDHHPEVPLFLERNARLNGLDTIPYVQCDWKDESTGLGTFDLILGSDLVYEPDHPDLLSGFIDRHARPRCEVVIVDPGRAGQARFNRCMTALGYSHASTRVTDAEYLDEPFRGQIRRYRRG